MIEPLPPNASPQRVAVFIEDMLRDLSELAAVKGYRGLATTLMIAALEAARASAGAPESPGPGGD
jgi:dihydroxyacetone kinase